MKKLREQRLAVEFRKNIYEILTTRVKDAEMTEMFSIQSVEVTNDLKHAKVYVSVFSGTDERKAATFNAIKNAAGFVRRELGAAMHIRTVPELQFITDNSLDYGERIDKLLSTLTYGEHNDDN
ncbi:MAG: 30S ribosome-binding factor RbfA [Clostridia bacterium]|nr:30S ribosome-binding factor RbfA [Clostridia bacterium]MBR2969344.1 30S ribosome-binding factor RbfA [Clostridia bacterium]